MKIEENRFTVKEYERGGDGYTTLTYDDEKVRILCFDANRDKNIIALVTNKEGEEDVREYRSLMGEVNGLKLVEYIYENGDFVTITNNDGKYVKIVKSYNEYTGHIKDFHYSCLMDEDETQDNEEVRLSTYEEKNLLKLQLERENKQWNYNTKDFNILNYHHVCDCGKIGLSSMLDEDDGFPTEMQIEKREKEYEKKLFEYLEKNDRKNRPID